MKPFVKTGLISEPSLAVCLAASAFVAKVIAEAPENFRGRGGLMGPVLVIPMFIQKMIIRAGGYGISTEGYNGIEKRLTRYNGYVVVPGYEYAILLFYPDQAPANGGAIYRYDLDFDFTQNNFLPDGKE